MHGFQIIGPRELKPATRQEYMRRNGHFMSPGRVRFARNLSTRMQPPKATSDADVALKIAERVLPVLMVD